MVEHILLDVELVVRERKHSLRPNTVTRVGSCSIDLRNVDVGHSDEPQWYQLVTAEGVNSPGMVLLQVRF